MRSGYQGGGVTDFNSCRIGYIDVSRSEGIAVLNIDRPEKLNALTREFWTDLTKALDMVSNDGATGAIVLRGAGERAFSVGGDIAGFSVLTDSESLEALQKEAMAAFMSIERCPVMVIAAVNGFAFGGGCELVLACDWAIAAENAVFAMPEATLGLLPGFGVIRGPDIIGRPMTKLMVGSGEKVNATRAREIGLVQKIVAAEMLMGEATAMAKQVARNSATALEVGKHLINHDLQQASIDYSTEAVTRLLCSPDKTEGANAFLERRLPKFARRARG
jgi:enoyl-CoA hydratase